MTTDLPIRKAYVDLPAGQMHVRTAGKRNGRRPLLCFHMSPYSGAQFEFLQPVLGESRLAVCPDTPGYGNSYWPESPPRIEDYGTAFISLCDRLEIDRFDVMGFHTGSVIALDLARRLPDRVSHVVAVGIPLMSEENRKKHLEHYSRARPFFSDPDFLTTRWKAGLDSLGGRSEERFLGYFSDSLAAGAETGNWGFAAVFDYPLRAVLGEIGQPVLVPVPNESLQRNSRDAALLLPRARLVEWPHMKEDLFDVNYPEIAETVCRFLDDETP